MLNQAHCKRNLVPPRKQAAYKLCRTKGSLSGLERVPRPLLRKDHFCCNRQHNSGVIHEQGRRHEVGPTLCSAVENLDLVCQETSDSQSLTHSRPAECGIRQATLARPDHPDWSLLPEVFQSICCRWHQPQIDLFATKFNKLPLSASLVLDPLASAADVLSLPWEDLDAYCSGKGEIIDWFCCVSNSQPSHYTQK